MRLSPPGRRTTGMIAKHASPHSYHWVLLVGRAHANPDPLSRLLAVAYLDEASGILGRGDPRWAVPRAYLRTTGTLEPTVRGGNGRGAMPPAMAGELARITGWLRRHHRGYLDQLGAAIRDGPPHEGFRRLSPKESRRRGFYDPTGRGLLAPHPPPVVTRTPRRSGTESTPGGPDPDELLPWRRLVAGR